MSGVNPKFILGPGSAATRNLGTCCCVHSKSRGGRKTIEKRKEQKWVKSNPTRGRNQHSKAGIYSGRAFSLSGWKKISLLFGLCDAFCCVSMCKFVYATGELEGVSVIYMVNTVAPLACCKRGGIFISLFLHSFFSPNISPRLPSSHPNQRTHRPLLGTPCPGNPPCTARYLRNTKHERLSSVVWWQLVLAKQWQGKTWSSESIRL